MLKGLFDLAWDVAGTNPGVKRRFVKSWYDLVSRVDPHGDMLFMNFGYANLNGDGTGVVLEPADEMNHYPIQLYHRVASAVDLTGVKLLEIGCGRGGGASYVKRYLKPRSMIAIDIAPNAISFCQRRHAVEGLTFVQGDAEKLTFANDEFDVVVNVESSHCYGRVDRFFGEAHRVLRPGGFLLFTDVREKEKWDDLRNAMHHAGFKFVDEENITHNVLKALEMDDARKRMLIQKNAPQMLYDSYSEFAGTIGSRIYQSFASGHWQYWRFVLKAN